MKIGLTCAATVAGAIALPASAAQAQQGDGTEVQINREDPDSHPIKPFVHWVAWNIPGTVTSLPEGLQEQLRLVEPEGVLQGRNSSGTHGYFGPKPPISDAAHHYHVQVLALDKMLDIPPTSNRDAFLAAAFGHVLAKGELVGLYQQKIEPPKP